MFSLDVNRCWHLSHESTAKSTVTSFMLLRCYRHDVMARRRYMHDVCVYSVLCVGLSKYLNRLRGVLGQYFARCSTHAYYNTVERDSISDATTKRLRRINNCSRLTNVHAVETKLVMGRFVILWHFQARHSLYGAGLTVAYVGFPRLRAVGRVKSGSGCGCCL